jgi:hypothetical protein
MFFYVDGKILGSVLGASSAEFRLLKNFSARRPPLTDLIGEVGTMPQALITSAFAFMQQFEIVLSAFAQKVNSLLL